MGTSPNPAQLARQTWCTLTIMILFFAFLAVASASDLNRQSIIFNENTPDVFYCPQEKPISIDRMLVKSRPMKKLCEHEGRALPKGAKSDCWNDVDETEYACTEKKRILLQLKPPGSENAIIDNYVPIFIPGEYKIVKFDKDGNPIYQEEEEADAKRKPKHA